MAENKKEKIIELKGVSRKFEDGVVAVDGIDLYVRRGEFVTFLGPSGCGKTTTLRMIAGFDKPTSGEILLNGKDITALPPNKRPINTVFQRYALFPHLNVAENIAFGLKLKKVKTVCKDKKGREVEKEVKLSKSVIAEKVGKALKMVDLEGFEKRSVTTLSGGQQQRVAIARALVNEPEILLLDEPLGALDLKMRKDMQLELKEMHRKLGLTFIYVTHDQEEALTMSDTIVVMKDGVIQQIGTQKFVRRGLYRRKQYIQRHDGRRQEGQIYKPRVRLRRRFRAERKGRRSGSPRGRVPYGRRQRTGKRQDHQFYFQGDTLRNGYARRKIGSGNTGYDRKKSRRKSQYFHQARRYSYNGERILVQQIRGIYHEEQHRVLRRRRIRVRRNKALPRFDYGRRRLSHNQRRRENRSYRR